MKWIDCNVVILCMFAGLMGLCIVGVADATEILKLLVTGYIGYLQRGD